MSHIRVDVAGIDIYVRSELECQHLTHINHKLAIAKLALHKIAKVLPSGCAPQLAQEALAKLGDAQ